MKNGSGDTPNAATPTADSIANLTSASPGGIPHNLLTAFQQLGANSAAAPTNSPPVHGRVTRSQAVTMAQPAPITREQVVNAAKAAGKTTAAIAHLLERHVRTSPILQYELWPIIACELL